MFLRSLARAACLVPLLILVVPTQAAEAAVPKSANVVHAPPSSAHPKATAYNSSGLTRDVFGYAYASSLGDPNVGYTTWDFSLLSTVAFFSIQVNYDGVLVADSNWTVWDSSTLTGLVNTAHAYGVKVVVTLKPLYRDTVDFCDALYNDGTTVYQIVRQVKLKGIDGVNIDYESQLAQCNPTNPGFTAMTNQALLTRFAKDLRAGLDGYKPGLYLSIATYSGSAAGNDGFFNIPDLNQYVDAFFVMAYDMDFANQSQGPLTGCTPHCMAPESPLANYVWNDTTSMSQYISVVGAGKTILGQPYYGTVACVASPVAHARATTSIQFPSYLDSAAAISSPDVRAGSYTIHRDANDPSGLDRWDTWYDNLYGCWREMYWSDTTTLGNRYDLVTQDNLRGVGFWTLNYGGGATELWTTIRNHFVACTSTDVAVSQASPQLSGVQVQLAATTQNCSSPRLAFYVLPPGGSWQLLQAYSSNPSYTWKTLGKPAGTYWLSIWAWAYGTPGIYGTPGAVYDSYKAIEYELTTQPCTAITASASPATALMGTAVAVTGSATGCPSPNYQVEMLPPRSSTWGIVQPYSPSATYNWNTTGSVPGTYHFIVKARDNSSVGLAGSTTGTWDVYAAFTYALTTSPCTGVTAFAAPASPQLSSTPVSITAAATGCPNPRYQFEMLKPGSQTWQVVQPYSSSATFNWNTNGAVQGTYRIIAKARDTSSLGTARSATGTWDAYVMSQYTLTSQPCSSVTASSSPSGTAPAGTAVTITGAASGCPSPQYQFEMLAPGSSTWQVVQPYSPTATFSWSTTGAVKGTYKFIVKARDASSAGTYSNYASSWDAYVIVTYTLT